MRVDPTKSMTPIQLKASVDDVIVTIISINGTSLVINIKQFCPGRKYTQRKEYSQNIGIYTTLQTPWSKLSFSCLKHRDSVMPNHPHPPKTIILTVTGLSVQAANLFPWALVMHGQLIIPANCTTRNCATIVWQRDLITEMRVTVFNSLEHSTCTVLLIILIVWYNIDQFCIISHNKVYTTLPYLLMFSKLWLERRTSGHWRVLSWPGWAAALQHTHPWLQVGPPTEWSTAASLWQSLWTPTATSSE